MLGLRRAAGDRRLLSTQCAPDARFDETIQYLDDDPTLFFDDGRERAATDRR
jgi:hypothetical protein